MTVEVLLDRLFAGNNFPPAYGGDLLKELRNDVLAARQAAFIALMLRVGAHGGGTAREAEDGLERFLAGGREERMAIVADPAFSIWLQKAARLEVAEQGVLGRTVADFRFVLQRCVERLGRDDLGLLRPVELLRHDVDPLVAEVAPPTYTFPALERVRELEEKTPYTLEIFNRVARATLSRIGAVWPEVQELFPYYVRAIVHVPDADFRSASASRYAGVIFLTADDHTILEVEESMVHEWGHQLLYSVMELDPIVVEGNQDDLKLPWSGARRDFYGYFHALFVYTLLLRYLERINGRDEMEMERVRALFLHILRGAVRALPDFADSVRFTPRGLELRRLLQQAVEARASRYPNLLEGDTDEADSRAAHG